jgi:hypothetical protein
MDDIMVKPFQVKKKPKNKNGVNSGAGFMVSLGYRGDSGFQASYKSPSLARELVIFNKPLSIAKDPEVMEIENEDL